MDFHTGVVKIHKPDRSLEGTGFVVSPRGLLVTCAHVIQMGRPALQALFEPFAIQIETCQNRRTLKATVIPDGWRDFPQDIAFLQIVYQLPPEVQPLPLGSYDDAQVAPFRSLGYSTANLSGDLAASGEILHRINWQGIQALQLQSEQLATGHSGSPVWDESQSYVVGIVNFHLQLRGACLAIPSEALLALRSELTLHPPVPKAAPSLSPLSRLFLPPRPTHFQGRQTELATLLASLNQASP